MADTKKLKESKKFFNKPKIVFCILESSGGPQKIIEGENRA